MGTVLTLPPMCVGTSPVLTLEDCPNAETGPVETSNYKNVILADTPTNYWRLGDTSGLVAINNINTKHGTISGGVTLNQPGIVTGNSAMLFDGTTGKIVTTDTIIIGTAFTIEAWIKTTDKNLRPIWSNRQVGGVPASAMMMGTNGNVLWLTSDALGSLSGTAFITDGQWHHIVWTLSGGVTDIYTDSIWNGGSGAPFSANTLTCSIGHDPQVGSCWNGSIDEVAIYSFALNQTQITAHYNAR